MPRCLVTRKTHFNAAHRLHNPERSPEWNQATFGLCNNPNYHGHNYDLEVTVAGEISSETGYVLDVSVLHEVIEREVLATLDHKNLNLDVPWFASRIPSAENIAVFCWDAIAPHLPAGSLTRVRLWETARNYVDYEGT